MVTEEEELEIVETFGKCPRLRLLEVSDKDVRDDLQDPLISNRVPAACIPLRYRQGFVPSVRIMEKKLHLILSLSLFCLTLFLR